MLTNHSSINPSAAHGWVVQSLFIALLSTLALLPANGQLAITEVMSSASPNGVQRDDFWELTNFGNDTIDLASYRFRDSGDFSTAVNLATLWANTRGDKELPQIGPSESILFVRSNLNISTPEEFRLWWGEASLPPALKIIFYACCGFSSQQDFVQLWQVTKDRTNLVHRVELFDSQPGRTFTYDPTTGVLDKFSAAGVDGAFVAAATDDVGSPGTNIGPVELRVVSAPGDTDVDGGSPVTFTVRAVGLPPPQYQWRFNGALIMGANSRTFTLAAPLSSDAGQYSVELDNGLERLVTTNATLTVNTQDSCARIISPMADIEVTPGQTAIFRVDVRGYPLPTFRWQFNGVDIPGATSRTHSVMGVGANHAGVYTVFIANQLCATNISARLTVVPVPKLKITEAMSFPNNRQMLGHDTWWELTNADTNAVNLLGYRWDDLIPSLEGAVSNTTDVILAPGQSAIFVSTMTPEAFRRWWGEEYLPADLPIISHPGNGLSTTGDFIRLWNATALTEDDYVVTAGVLDTNALPTMGVSLEFDPKVGDLGIPSVEGERGAFRAAEGGDIGSPGWTSNAQRIVRPRLKSIRRESNAVALTWSSEPGRNYEVRTRDMLGSTNWNLLITKPADSNTTTALDTTATNNVQRFYRIILLPQP